MSRYSHGPHSESARFCFCCHPGRSGGVRPRTPTRSQAQPEPTTKACHLEQQSDEGSAVALPPAIEPTCSAATSKTQQPSQIQILKAAIDPNRSISHTYQNQKMQPSWFQTHAETRGEGLGAGKR